MEKQWPESNLVCTEYIQNGVTGCAIIPAVGCALGHTPGQSLDAHSDAARTQQKLVTQFPDIHGFCAAAAGDLPY